MKSRASLFNVTLLAVDEIYFIDDVSSFTVVSFVLHRMKSNDCSLVSNINSKELHNPCNRFRDIYHTW